MRVMHDPRFSFGRRYENEWAVMANADIEIGAVEQISKKTSSLAL